MYGWVHVCVLKKENKKIQVLLHTFCMRWLFQVIIWCGKTFVIFCVVCDSTRRQISVVTLSILKFTYQKLCKILLASKPDDPNFTFGGSQIYVGRYIVISTWAGFFPYESMGWIDATESPQRSFFFRTSSRCVWHQVGAPLICRVLSIIKPSVLPCCIINVIRRGAALVRSI